MLKTLLLMALCALAPIAAAEDLPQSEPENEAAQAKIDPLRSGTADKDFDLWFWADGLKVRNRERWHPLGDISYRMHNDFSGNEGELHSLQVNINLASFYPLVYGLDAKIETGDINGRDVRRGSALGYIGFLFEDTSHPEEQSFGDLFDPKRRSNTHEFGFGFEWGVVEMKRFFPDDDRTFGGFRYGLRSHFGYQHWTVKAAAAVEIYTDRTAVDLSFEIGYGRPKSPIGVVLGFRNLTTEQYHGNFLSLGFDYSF